MFGNSSGAVVGLELAARHPEQMRTLIAHEPPVTELLPDNERYRAASQEIYDTYLSEGAGPAMQKFMAVAGLNGGPETAESGPQSLAGPEMLAAMARMQANVEFFFAHMFRAITAYVPDIATLQAASTRIVVAVGDASEGQTAHQAGRALAERLGTDAVVFPGGHGGPGVSPSRRCCTRCSAAP